MPKVADYVLEPLTEWGIHRIDGYPGDGIKGFTESVPTELRHEGSAVHVTMYYFPGVNTPQFQRVLNKLPTRPRPVAPVLRRR
jgi:hypothetical protein